MASPISFGDAVAMSKIAWRIAHAFTKGRRSAPAEFREVENQLYSLSAALTAFQDVCGGDLSAISIDPTKLPARFQNEEQDGAQALSGILDTCSETLTHLEKIVEKYGIVATQKDPTKSRLQRWSAELVKNYKKIAWTTEAGDLAALRSQLMVHTNSLDLVMGIVVSSRTSRIEDSLRDNSSMIREIHAWWAQNLRDATTARSKPAPTHEEDQLGIGPIIFEVYLAADSGLQLLCARASLHDDWDMDPSQLFACRCRPKHPRVGDIAMSPFCFPARQAGEQASWTLFKARDKSTNRLVSITIRNIAACDIRDFEDSFVRPLAEETAKSMSQQGINNGLAHMPDSDSEDPRYLRLLNLHSDLKSVQKLVSTVAFRVGFRSLLRTNVKGLSLLNYRELGHQSIGNVDSGLDDYAELGIYYGNQETNRTNDITESVLQLKLTTMLKLVPNDASVMIEKVECMGFSRGQISRLEKTDVVIQMTTVEAATQLYRTLEDMKTELTVMGLQYPRQDETVALHLQAVDVACEEVCVPDAEIIITRKLHSTVATRLIVASRDRCTVLSQSLVHWYNFRPDSPDARGPEPPSPTWLVQTEGKGTRKVRFFPKGVKHLSVCDVNGERLLELGVATLDPAGAALHLGHSPVEALPFRVKSEE